MIGWKDLFKRGYDMPELTKEGKHWLLQDGEIISMDSRNKLILEKSEVEEIDRRLKALDDVAYKVVDIVSNLEG